MTNTCLRLWQVAADGGLACNNLAETAFRALLQVAEAGDCDQQHAADLMIDMAHQLSNSEMIRCAILYAQQLERVSPPSLYCQAPPRNPELFGIFPCQNGEKGTTPGLGRTATLVLPPASCSAHPSTDIADESQLTDAERHLDNTVTSSNPTANSTTSCSETLLATAAVHTSTPEATEVVTTTQDDNVSSTPFDSATITTGSYSSPSIATAHSSNEVSTPSSTSSRLSVGQSMIIVAGVILGFLVLSIRFKKQKTTKRHSRTTNGSMTIEETTMFGGGVRSNVLSSFASILRRLVTLGWC